MDTSGQLLWQPTDDDIRRSRLFEYKEWLRQHRHLTFDDYHALWQWSVDQSEDFWTSIVSFFDVKFHTPAKQVLHGTRMPDITWFDGATLNYGEHIYRGMQQQDTAIFFFAENGKQRKIGVSEMWREVVRFQQYYLLHGVSPGDRIAGYLPNIPEATFAFIAAISLGAVWSCCSQDFGVSSVVDRFAQIEPVLLIAADGYYYNGKTHHRASETLQIVQSLPSLRNTLIINYTGTDEQHAVSAYTHYHTLPLPDSEPPTFVAVPFSAPLWILYSSGTTGAPKAITHSHGGCLLEHLKYLAFHNDVHAGERFFWYSTTGWMMWNYLHGAMLHGASIVLYDGSPGFPSLERLWKIASELPVHHFGTSAPFLVACMKEHLHPGHLMDLSRMRSIGSTGSPLPPEAFDWVYNSIHARVWLCSMSGGTDVCTAFVGGLIERPVYAGEIQARGLGCALFAFDENQQPIEEKVGEMVITKPMPSMPVFFWNDPEKQKYSSSYFEEIPGVWRHGDWVKITAHDGVIIYGRSDATLNRQGVRIGTAEIYSVLNSITEIEDSLIVNLELEGGRHYMPLFVKLRKGELLDVAIKQRIVSALRTACSPRHVPDDIISTPDIPYTISGKKMEAPVKKLLMGMPVEKSLSKDAMRNPESLEFYRKFVIPVDQA